VSLTVVPQQQERLLEILDYLDEVEKSECTNRTSPLPVPCQAAVKVAPAPDEAYTIITSASHSEVLGNDTGSDISNEMVTLPNDHIVEKENFHVKDCGEGPKKWVWDTLAAEADEEEEAAEQEAFNGRQTNRWDDNEMSMTGTMATSAKASEASLVELSMMQQEVINKTRAMKAELQARSDEAEELEDVLLQKKAAYSRAKKSTEQVSLFINLKASVLMKGVRC